MYNKRPRKKVIDILTSMFTRRMQLSIRAFLLLALASFAYNADAFHIIGGEVTYECLGFAAGDTTERSYRFEMRVYRDCNGQGANFDMPAEFGIYREVNGVYTFVRVFNTNPISIRFVPPPDDPCLIIPENVCVEEGIYEFNINLPIIDGSYHVFWRRCCRNQTINNIIDPRNTGATYTVEITAAAQRLCNDSPRFKSFPPTVICVDNPLNFDHGAVDSEGDQLVYEFCAPLVGGGPAGGTPGSGDRRACNGIQPDPANCPPPFDPVTFVGPAYTPLTPLGGNPEVSINPNTGRITGRPLVQGQFVVGVCVYEFRNGELLSVLRRDFQFNVSMCEIAVTADIAADTNLLGQRFVINSCGENTVTFINLSEKQENIQSYRWIFDIAGSQQFSFNRDATITFPGVGEYEGRMIINEGLACADTADIKVNVFPDIESDFEFDYDTCFGSPVQFIDKSYTGSGEMTDWQWDFGDGLGSSELQIPNYLYPDPGDHVVNLSVTDINQCTAEITKSIAYYPVPPFLVVEPSSFFGCTPAQVAFNNLSSPIDSTYSIQWDFGDGGTSNDLSPTHTYQDPGLYTVSVDITSPIGCNIKTGFVDWIQIKESPRAGFGYSPERPTSFNSTVAFFDESINANAWQWTFGEEGTAFDRNPTYMFQDTGVKLVEQVVFRENGCTDTAYAEIDVIPEITYHLPNAFTPNNDSKNDLYMGVGILTGVREFEMTIWSRWGELVFETSDPSEGWNGRMRNSGEELPMGVYICKVSYLTPRDERIGLEEFATLIR